MVHEFRRSPLALAVLGLLEAGPLHPYGIQQRIKQWGKDQVVNVGQRATLYKMISRLEESGLIAVHDTERDQRYPERTTYRITETGQAAAQRWLSEILSTPRNEFPEFPAGLSFLPLITPQQASELLKRRQAVLTQRLTETEEQLATALKDQRLPRVTQLEAEYLRTLIEAELRWVTSILADLRNGSITWNREQLEAIATAIR